MKWLALFSLIVANLIKEPSPVIRVDSGLLRGRISDNGQFYQYFGIPYGTVNEKNRFQAPLPAPKWDGIFEAINENCRCSQKMIGPLVAGQTDCLKLNIYTPITAKNNKLPVMVYIHGGSFFEGTGTAFLYGPDFFVERDVIFVGINYRLNVEGFLCLGIKEAPGNAGLKDQSAALSWIKKNIAAFGGDPDNVTLFGESAGAVSVSYHIISPLSKGLFQRAIIQSGSTLAPWSLQHDPIKTASSLAKEFGYNGSDPFEIYKVLSRRSVEDLIGKLKNERPKTLITSEILFTPCVEKEINGVDAMITEYPGDIISSGNYTKVPMIVGYNDREGIYFVSSDFGTTLTQTPKDILKEDLEFPSEWNKNKTVEEMNEYYFASGRKDLIMDMVNLYSDLHFKYPAVIESELYAKTNDRPMYYYLFKYSGFINNAKFISQFVFTKGASHGDELFYMFKPHTFPLPTRYFELKMIERMVTLWTNFAKYGDPTPSTTKLLPVKWKPSRSWNPTALVIDHHITTAPMWDEGSVRFWNKTYNKYRRRNYGLLTPVVEISQGKLQGLRSVFGQNRYYNIPFAVADRFQKPKRPPNWKGIFKAIYRSPSLKCPQWRASTLVGVEDCLLLDVYTPEWTKPGVKLPVMIYFHGGAYYMGAKNLYDPEFLVVKNVIVVTANYRLGVLGFLCLNDISNLGLWDQVAALKWIQSNIVGFGGDEENVTICGESAGASSASFHMVSKASKGLFHKAILMSGTALSAWAFNVEPVGPTFEDARRIAPVQSGEDVIKLFTKIPLRTLIKATKDTSVNPRYFKYSPCVDANSSEPFFIDAPYNIIKSRNFNHVPVMMGYTESEGSYFYGLLNEGSVRNLNENFDDMIPCLFTWCSDNERREIAKSLRTHYFDSGNITINSVNSLVKYYSDWVAYAAIAAFSRVLTKFSNQPVYNYLFSYEGDREFARFFVSHLKGPVHGGELFYIFKPFGISMILSARDRRFIDKLTTMIANFMKYGNPTPKSTKYLPLQWPRATSNSSNIMVLDKQPVVIDQPYERHRGDFFLSLLCKYGLAGYVPCDSAQMCTPR
ncbi:uncharacterized protein LOC123699375 [Colias croceus]|uniref:uncharacterized protein LOC123699375 n=1 Tax=Colias crocea TaxID=72248 RepID=UPI001E27DCA5|nr:uncharacterized protein LOC123699375 [Colias croceus]